MSHGTNSELTGKFGRGLRLEVKMNKAAAADQTEVLREALERMMPRAEKIRGAKKKILFIKK